MVVLCFDYSLSFSQKGISYYRHLATFFQTKKRETSQLIHMHCSICYTFFSKFGGLYVVREITSVIKCIFRLAS